MKIGKRLLSILVCFTIIICTVSVSRIGFEIEANAATYKVGDIIEYGEYPQGGVGLGEFLILKDYNGIIKNWKSYEYYSGNGSIDDGQMHSSNFMQYCDVSYEGEKYRGVRIAKYRPSNTGEVCYEGQSGEYNSLYDNVNAYESGYYVDSDGYIVQWFKYEPIRWRVLNPISGLVMCDSIIDCQPYNNFALKSSGETYGNSNKSFFANDYANSSIRVWLNNDFYNTAFTSSQKNNIKKTSLNNNCFENGSEEYANNNTDKYNSQPTTDNIFLLSYEEIGNTAYGFDSLTAPCLKGTQYAKWQGLYVYDLNNEYKGNSNWFLRSPYVDSFHVCSVNFGGDKAVSYVANNIGGICPAMCLSTVKNNIYNLGEETYGFKNYTDTDSPIGHCYGMSMTSSAYYLGILDIKSIGCSKSSDLYNMSPSQTVKNPICYYQGIQGDYALNSTVAGGNWYKTYNSATETGTANISSDWSQVTSYVKNHNYDNKGSLQFDFRKIGEGGHAVNFLRYEVVNGQERIYTYDNNFPDIETYFYQDTNGRVYEAPSQTFSGALDCVTLRDVAKFFKISKSYDETKYVYARKGDVAVDGAKAYPCTAMAGKGEYIMYKISGDPEIVKITPKSETSKFEYMDEQYKFGEESKGKIAYLKLAKQGDNSDKGSFYFVDPKMVNAKLNVKPSATVDYRSKVIITANASNVTSNCQLVICEGKNVLARGDYKSVTYDAGEMKEDKTFSVYVVDKNGTIIQNNSEGNMRKDCEIKVNKGLFTVILAFFKGLFGLLPTVEIKP